MHLIQTFPSHWLVLVLAVILTVPGEAVDSPVKLDVIMSGVSSSQAVNISCSLDPGLTSMKTVDDLKIYGPKPNSKKSDFQTLASVNRWDPNPRLFGSIGGDSVNIDGFFGFKSNTSELSLSWTSSSQISGQRYKCSAQGVDRFGQNVVISELVSVVEQDSPQFCHAENVDSLLQSSMFVGRSIANVERRIDDLETAIDTSSQHVSDTYSIEMQNLMKEQAQKINDTFHDLERNTANNSKDINSFLQGLQASMQSLQRTGLADVERRIDDLETALNTSYQHVSDKFVIDMQNLLKKQAQKRNKKFHDLERKTADSSKDITSFLQGFGDTMKSLQQTLAGQASAIRRLEARAVFDMSEEFRGKNYLVSRSEEAFNIQNADASCEAFGGYLVEVDDQQEFDFLVKFLESVGGAHYFATATNDIDKEGKFVFYHSKKPIPFKIWEYGEPDNQYGNEDCTAINYHRDGLNDIPCATNVKYICEVSF